ncbi:peptidase M19 [Solitalea longa]|uniref:Peptidase M19 n=1 Tax=Solitalea longa TaxID=2079460 RepID=A0A2S5A765_9SPHI|nr:membrane dipeptidase [Solitalea longa]POY38428.1 peptidase M19 [Solitalea longa]
MKNVFADIHCHPTMKSYGQSFNREQGTNSSRTNDRSSIWYYDPPNLSDKLLNFVGGITRFSQSNLTALGYGNVGLICASLYPIEKLFFNNHLGSGKISDVVNNFITGVGKKRVDFIQSSADYFTDLEQEYAFLQQLDGKIYTIDNQKYRYVIVKSYAEVESLLIENDPVFTIAILITFEGCHALGTGMDPVNKPSEEALILSNLDKVKNWPHKPLFVTFAHHFYNELCGQAKSLKGIVGTVCDQSYKLGEGFTELGKSVARKLLDNTNGKRILIDIKHMSRKSRLEYFDMLATEYSNERIPIVASHGGVCGNETDRHFFVDEEINFYDDELLLIARSRGLFGVQLDERRIASKAELENTKGSILRKKILYNWSRLVWRQIEHIAILLDANGLFAWDIQCLGSDYDGIVDPINGYWTSEEFQFLDDYLLKHAYNFENNGMKNLHLEHNKIAAEQIVNRFMSLNVQEFVSRNF